MYVNDIDFCGSDFSITFKGTTERDTLIESLEMVLDELKNNKRV
jgi:hypothetical protein